GGRTLDRAALRRFTAPADDQLVLWPLLPIAPADSELALDDLDPVGELVETVRRLAAGPDPKCDRLRELLADGRITVVFVGARETVHHLRDRLGRECVAWCTGEAAGIGPLRVPRATVLELFSPAGAPARGSSVGPRPTVLVTTDVSAEGLDLQRAERVVHYDLPWTAVRLEQRDGRALRLGSAHPVVDVVRMEPAAELEHRLRQLELLERKSGLPAAAGLTAAGRRRWRWRLEIADRFGARTSAAAARSGIAAVGSETSGALVGFELIPVTDCQPALDPVFHLGWIDSTGAWSEDPDLLERRLVEATSASAGAAPTAEEIHRVLTALLPVVRRRLVAAALDRWRRADPTAGARRLIRRLNALAAAAVRRRRDQELAAIERAMRFARGGHTAGEAMLVEALAELPEPRLRERLPLVPEPSPEPPPLEPRLVGLIVFRPPRRPGPGGFSG
ncbi:MAG TPA: C-terminal helicase domain-containing protein, partial [Gemmatimonadales bacterium]|nr:C-terminal helicase domain-containing protein [Gemmatimonadales bacterium]